MWPRGCGADVRWQCWHGLVVNAFYPDGYQRVWFDDLATGKKSLLMKLASDMHVQLPGWDRIPVAAA